MRLDPAPTDRPATGAVRPPCRLAGRQGRGRASGAVLLLAAACLGAGFLSAGTAPVRAGPIADAAAEAEKLAAEGRNREAFDALARAADTLWTAAPLELRKLLFVEGDPKGFGVYDPRPGTGFKAGEALRIYAEPFGFGHVREGDWYKIAFEIRIAVANPDGSEAIAPRAGSLQLKSRNPNREFMLHFAYVPKGLKPGGYLLLAEVKDTATGKIAQIRMPFQLQ